MSAFTVGSIAENTAEDLIDEGVSNLVYSIGNCYFGGTTNQNCTNIVDNAFNEAIEGATQTLKYSIMHAVIFKVTEYAMTRLIAGGGILYAYIKSGGIISKVKNKLQGKKFPGKSGLGRVGNYLGVLNGSKDERLKLAGMANDSLNTLPTVIAQERQVLSFQKSEQRKQLMTTLGLNQKSKGLNDQKKIEAYNYKMKTGTWEVTSNDKKLFETVVPKMYRSQDFSFNLAFVQKLNTYSEYAITTENKLVNLAQTHLDLMTAHNIAKAK